MRPPVRALATLAVVLAAASLWLGWRWAALGRAVAARQRALGAALAPVEGDTPRDASSRVALAVEANEALFEEALALAAARRVAGALCATSAGLALGLGAWTWRRRMVGAGHSS